MSKLHLLHQDKHLMTEMRASLDLYLGGEIIARVLDGKDVSGYKEAKDVLASWFRELDKEFKKDTPKKEKEFTDAE